MIGSRLISGKVLSSLLIAAVAALTLQCGGESGGGVTPPTDPEIALSSSTASFSATAGGPAPAPQTITITNSGGGTLDGLETSISYTAGQAAGWLTAVLSATDVPSTLILNVAPGSLAPATYSANVAITSSTATNSPQTLAVTLTVAPSTGGAHRGIRLSRACAAHSPEFGWSLRRPRSARSAICFCCSGSDRQAVTGGARAVRHRLGAQLLRSPHQLAANDAHVDLRDVRLAAVRERPLGLVHLLIGERDELPGDVERRTSRDGD